MVVDATIVRILRRGGAWYDLRLGFTGANRASNSRGRSWIDPSIARRPMRHGDLAKPRHGLFEQVTACGGFRLGGAQGLPRWSLRSHGICSRYKASLSTDVVFSRFDGCSRTPVGGSERFGSADGGHAGRGRRASHKIFVGGAL